MSNYFYNNLKKWCFTLALIFTASIVFSQGLSGIYTIDPLGTTNNYTTLKEAIDSLNSKGVGTGGVTFNIVANFTETSPVGGYTVSATGTAANPIVFQKSGIGANPLLTAYIGGVGTPAVAADGIFRLVGSDYVTIDGIDLSENAANTANPATMEYGYGMFKSSVTNGCQYVNIKNCVVTLSNLNNASTAAPMVEGSVGIMFMNSTAAAPNTVLTVTLRSGTNSYNTIQSNTIQNCNYGIAMIGFAGSTPFLTTDTLNTIGGLTIDKGNIIRNYGGAAAATNPAAGIRTLAQYGLLISYNNVNNNTGSNTNHLSTLRGIYLNTATSANATISNNIVNLSGGATVSQISGIENVSGGTSASNTINITNNQVRVKYLTATTGTVYGIYNTASATTVNIKNNNVSKMFYSGVGLLGTGTIYGIYNTGSTPNLFVNNNTIDSIVRSGTTGATTIGIYTSSGTIQTLKNNSISNIIDNGTIGTAGILYGIQVAGTTVVVDSNTVTNLTNYKTTSTAAMYGIYNFGFPSNENYNYNTITNLTNLGTGALFGLYSSTSSGVKTISNNTINTLSGKAAVDGIRSGSSTPSIFKNKINNITTNGVTGLASGITLTTVSSVGATIYNNFISDLKAPIASNTTDAVRGINITSTTSSSNVNIYYNTIYLSATSSGANFYTSGIFHTYSATATSASLVLKNNIIVNKSVANGTGLTVALRRSASTDLANYNTSSNNNIFYAGTPSASNLIYYDGTNADQLLSDFKTRVAPREIYTSTEDVQFTNTTTNDLHILGTVTLVESNGVAISGITTDMDNQVRPGPVGSVNGGGVAPDIGADEIDAVPSFPFGDIIAPSFTLDSISPALNLNACLGSSHTFYATITDAGSAIDSALIFWNLGTTAQTPISMTHVGNKYQGTILGYLDSTISYSFRAVDASVNKNRTNVAGSSYLNAKYSVIPVVSQATVTAGTTIQLTSNVPVTTKMGTGTTSNATSTTVGAAYATYYGNGRQQWLIRASELKASGVPAGVIKSIGYKVTGLATGADTLVKNYTIRLANTSVSTMTSAMINTGLVTVTTPVNYKPVLGINTHVTNNAFSWDGVSNLVVEVCFENGVTGNASTQTELTVTPFTSTTYYQVDGVVAACGSNSVSGTSTNRPNIFVESQSVVTSATWSQTAGGGIASTTAINTTVTPLTAGTYTYTLTASNGTCSSTNDVTLTVLNPAAPIAQFRLSNDTATVGSNTSVITLTDQSLNLPSAWEWTITPSTYVYVNSTTKNSTNPQVSFTATGLYSVKLKATNITGADSLTKVDSIRVIPGYCVAGLHNFSSNCIDTVIVGTMTNITTSCALPSYTVQSATTIIEKATPTPISVTTGTTNSIMSVWIDYNQNGFLEASEHYQLATSARIGTATIFIPATAKSGITKMRVRSRSVGSPNGPTDACTTFGSGETEDYDINIVTPVGDFYPPDFANNKTILPAGGACAPTSHTVSVGISDTTGVDSAWVIWSVNNIASTPILMTNAAGIYSGTIPVTTKGSSVVYSFKAIDSSPRKNIGTIAGGSYTDATFYVDGTSSADSIVIGSSVNFSVNVEPKPIIGNGTSITTSAPSPYYTTWFGNKEQYLIKASELSAQGIVAGAITSIGLNVGTVTTTLALTNFTISMKNATLAALTGTFETGLTPVYTNAAYTVLPNQVNSHTFQTPFVWDGISDVIIETCFNNTNWNGSQQITYTTTPFVSCIYSTQDNATVCSNTSGTTSSNRPNFLVGQPSSVAFTWASNLPTAGLSATNIPTPTATPTALGNYEFYVTASNGTCSNTDTIKVKVKPPTPPIAGFVASSTLTTTILPITLSDTSTNLPDVWNWTITPNTVSYVNTTTNASKNPEVLFNTAGLYTVKLKAANIGGSDSITKVDYIRVLTGYCTSAATSTDDEDIGQVVVGVDTFNSPGPLPITVNPASTNLYSSFLNFNGFSANRIVPKSISVSIINPTTSVYTTTVNVFVDLNHNGVFDLPIERLYKGKAANNTNSRTVTGTITVPINAINGVTGMRVVATETSNTNDTLPACGTYFWGETEDYLFNILSPPPGDYYPPDFANQTITPAGGGCDPVSHTVSLTISDTTGVDSAWVAWNVDGVSQPNIFMSHVGSTYSAVIPAAGSGRVVYGFIAVDNSINKNFGTYAGGAYRDALLKSKLDLGDDGYIAVGGSYSIDGTVRSTPQIGTGTTVSTGPYSPYYTTWWGNRQQYLIKASELSAQGVLPGAITSLGLNVGTVSTTYSLTNFTISMSQTSLTALTSTFETGLAPVFTDPAYIVLPSQVNTHIFQSPFVWDGVSNIIIETCFNNSGWGGAQQITYTTTPFTSCIYSAQDAPTVCANASGSTGSNRPNFLVGQPVTATYSWTAPSNGGLSATNIPNPIATPTGGIGAYQYILSVNDGTCTALDTIVVNVLTNPVVNLNGPTGIICSAAGKVLDAGNVGSTYQWELDNVPIANTQTMVATTAGTYKVTVTNQAGLSSTDTIRLTIGGALSLSIPDKSLCIGGSITVNAGTFTSYLWSTGATTANLNISNPGTYSVSVTNAGGCSVADTFVVTSVPAPSFTLGADMGICVNSTTSLDAGNAGSTYLWSTNATTQVITVSTAGTYSVIVHTPTGCTLMDTIVITSKPAPTKNLGADVSICPGSAVSLDAGNTGATYLWSTGATTKTINVTAANTYRVTVTSANGCVVSDTIVVSLKAAPVVTLGADQNICNSDTVTLDAGNAGSTYLWSTGATTRTIRVSDAGTYTVTVTNVNGCSSSDAVIITNKALPNAAYTIASSVGQSVQFQATSTVGLQFAWNFGDPTSAANTSQLGSPTHVFTAAGVYTVTLTVTNVATGCKATTSQVVTVLGVGNDYTEVFKLNAAPNPFVGQTKINYVLPENANNVSIEVYDMIGRKVATVISGDYQAAGSYQFEYKNEDLQTASGVYMVRLIVDGKIAYTRIIDLAKN